uniref:Uncharacterized protein n=1 Tax=Anguilla anguilla TaxID=7936 RepID=A0A0E9XRC3_ANGAN
MGKIDYILNMNIAYSPVIFIPGPSGLQGLLVYRYNASQLR